MLPIFIHEYSKRIQEIDSGHTVRYQFRLMYLGAKLKWPFVVDYCTNCAILPTSFRVEMGLQHAPVSGYVLLPFSVKRTDSMNRPVYASVSYKITDTNGVFFICLCENPSVFRLMPGEIASGDFSMTLFPEAVRTYNEEIIVTIGISVLSCHLGVADTESSASDIVSSASTSENISCSKL